MVFMVIIIGKETYFKGYIGQVVTGFVSHVIINRFKSVTENWYLATFGHKWDGIK